jgi:hypothetical protein
MEEPIDLNKLSQRELLIVVARDVNELKEEIKAVRELDKRVSNIETKNKVWASVVAFFTVALSEIGITYFSTKVK